MKVVIQRVSEASLAIKNKEVASVGTGLVLLLGIANDDTFSDLDYIVKKVVNCRIFPDENGRMNLSIIECGGELLLVSQFTLLADTRKGNRPSYVNAAPPHLARNLYDKSQEEFSKKLGKPISTGVFGAEMKVSLVNEGPVTVVIDSKNK